MLEALETGRAGKEPPCGHSRTSSPTSEEGSARYGPIGHAKMAAESWSCCRLLSLLDSEHVFVGRVVVGLALVLQDLERAKMKLGRVGRDSVDRVSIVGDGLERSQDVERLLCGTLSPAGA